MTETEFEKNEFVPIPLPSQIPEPPDLSKVPLSVIHSATVETLLSQTEDLMARLKVQIRRNAVLERRALDFEDKTVQLEKQMQTLQQQNEMFIEKDQTQSEKVRELQTQLESSTRELSLLELRYNETFALGQKKESEANRMMTDLNAQITELKKLIPLEQENIKIRDENNYFKSKIDELCTYIQRKEEDLLALKNQLTAKTDGITALEETIKKLKAQVDFNQKVIEEKAELENALIVKEREKEHAVKELHQTLAQQNQELQNLRAAYKAITQERHHAGTQLQTLEATAASLQRDNNELEKQVENLQNLWYKLQGEFEKEKTKNTALNKLNRELALQLHHKIAATGTEDEYFKKFLLQNHEMEP